MIKPVVIREVWASNLEKEFDLINRAIHDYPFISMDMEFPGVIYLPKVDSTKPYLRHHLKPYESYHYLKANVDELKIIQVGLTLTDMNGNLPNFDTDNGYIWQFNFCDFDVERDPHNHDSIDMLRRQGIDFNRNVSHGIDSSHFAKLMLESGLIKLRYVVWVTFHSAYDFGYLVKILTRRNLPNNLEDFLIILKRLFGNNVYDMKHMIRYCNSLYGGLERVATTLNVGRVVGKSHQAGSDSLLTWQAFKKMMDTYFINNEAGKYAGVLFGLEIAAR